MGDCEGEVVVSLTLGAGCGPPVGVVDCSDGAAGAGATTGTAAEAGAVAAGAVVAMGVLVTDARGTGEATARN